MMITRPGKRLQKTMERSTMLLMGKLTISMAIFNSYVTNYQRVSVLFLMILIISFVIIRILILILSFVSRSLISILNAYLLHVIPIIDPNLEHN